MAVRSNLAYDNVSVKPQRKEETFIKKAPKRAKVFKPFSTIAIISFIALILGFMIYGMVQVNETTSQINTLSKQLNVQKNDSVRLEAEMGSKMSMKSLEEHAKTNLGMTEAKPSQVTYINISKGNEIEIPQKNESNGFKDFVDGIKNFFK